MTKLFWAFVDTEDDKTSAPPKVGAPEGTRDLVFSE
jgi:hypothetical protein